MKSMYVCEYCGYSSTDYDAIAQCERAHSQNISMADKYDVMPDTEFPFMTFTRGDIAPDVITLKVGIPDADAWGTKRNDDGNALYKFVQYKRVDKRDARLNDLERECLERQAADRVQNEKWLAERAAEKAASTDTE